MLDLIMAFNTGGVLICGLIVLANPREVNKIGNRWLGLFLICLFAQLFINYLDSIGQDTAKEWMAPLVLVALFVLPVAFYFSIIYFITPGKKFEKKDLPYFSLLILYVISFVVYFLMVGKPLVFNEEMAGAKISRNLFSFFFYGIILQSIIYWILGYRKLRKYKSKVSQFSAAETDVNLYWLQNVNYFYVSMVLLWIFSILIEKEWAYTIANLSYLVGSFYILWNTLKQQEIFPLDKLEKKEIKDILLSEENVGAGLPHKTIHETDPLKAKLLAYMETQKPHLENDLNLIKLSRDMGVSHHKLSQILNQQLDTNFSSFVNQYRAKAAKEILTDPEKTHYTMLQVAFEAGYNSKTVFNTHFKRVTNMTPSAYKKQH